MDDLGPRPSNNRERVELIARAICAADDYPLGVDEMVYPGEPMRSRYGYIPATEPRPRWHAYVRMAAAAADAEWTAAQKAQNLNKEPTT